MGQTCVPSTGTLLQCISHAGKVPCPIISATQYLVASRFIDDMRGCSPCACAPGGASGSCGTEILSLYATTDCSGAPAGTVTSGVTCAALMNTSIIHSVEIKSTTVGVGCLGSGGATEGDETPVDQQTICCP